MSFSSTFCCYSKNKSSLIQHITVPNAFYLRGPNGAKYSHYLLQPGNGISSSAVSSNVASSPGSSSTSSAAAAAAAAVQHHQHQQQHHQPSYEHGSRRPDWRPGKGVLVASLAEHGGSVNRLALSQDQAFFVSASSDGTCKACPILYAVYF